MQRGAEAACHATGITTRSETAQKREVVDAPAPRAMVKPLADYSAERGKLSSIICVVASRALP